VVSRLGGDRVHLPDCEIAAVERLIGGEWLSKVEVGLKRKKGLDPNSSPALFLKVPEC